MDVGPDESLTYLMAKVEHLLERRLDVALAEHGLTLRQFSVLTEVGRTLGLSSAGLSQRLLISRQAVNTLVQRLLTAGLISKGPSRATQALVLTLTDAGLEACQRATPRATEAEAASLGALEPAEVDAARQTLQRILTHLSDHDETHHLRPARAAPVKEEAAQK